MWLVESGADLRPARIRWAGRASTVRMLFGLSTPDIGTAYIADDPVGLGAPVLHRAGVLIGDRRSCTA